MSRERRGEEHDEAPDAARTAQGPLGTDCHEFVDYALVSAQLVRGRRQVPLPAASAAEPAP